MKEQEYNINGSVYRLVEEKVEPKKREPIQMHGFVTEDGRILEVKVQGEGVGAFCNGSKYFKLVELPEGAIILTRDQANRTWNTFGHGLKNEFLKALGFGE